MKHIYGDDSPRFVGLYLNRLMMSCLLLISMGSLQLLHAQDFTVDIVVPSVGVDKFSVCGPEQQVTFTITNQSGEEITLTEAAVTLPEGFVYQSLEGGSNYTIVNPLTPSFTRVLPMPDGTTESFTINVKADCGAAQFIAGGAIVNLDLTYSGGTNSTESFTSPEMEILFNSFSFSNVEPSIFQGQLGVTDTLEVTLVNGGQGAADELYYYILAHDLLNFEGLYHNGTLLTPSSTSGDTTFYLIGESIINQADHSSSPIEERVNWFQFNETLIFQEIYTVTGCSMSPDGIFRGARVNCLGSSSCAEGEASLGTETGLNLTSLSPELSAYFHTPYEDQFEECYADNYTTHTYIMVNTGGVYARDIKFSTSVPLYNNQTAHIDISQTVYKINSSGTYASMPSNPTYQNSRPSTCINGVTDAIHRADYNLAGDVFLEPGDTLFVSFSFLTGCGCNSCSIVSRAKSDFGYYIRSYADPCQFASYPFTRTYNEYYPRDVRLGNFPEVPGTLGGDGNGFTATYNFSYFENDYYRWADAERDDYIFRAEYTISEGLDYVGNPVLTDKDGQDWPADLVTYTDNEGGSDVLILEWHGDPPSGWNTHLEASINIDFETDCDEAVESCPVYLNIHDELRFITGAGCTECSDGELVACPGDVEILLTCPFDCDSCVGLSTVYYEMNRTSYGIADNDNNGTPVDTDAIDENLINRKRFLRGDEAELEYRGVVYTNATHPSFDYGVVTMSFPSNLSNYAATSASVEVKTAAGDVYYCAVAQTIKVGNTLRTNISPSSLASLGCTSIPADYSYVEGDSVIVKVGVLMQDYISANPTVLLMAGTGGLAHDVIDNNPTLYGCNERRDRVYLIGYLNSRTISGSTVGGCSYFASQYFYHTNLVGNSRTMDFFPYEYREVSFPKSITFEKDPQVNFKDNASWGIALRLYRKYNSGDSHHNIPLSSPYISIVGDIATFDIEGFLRDNDISIDEGVTMYAYISTQATCLTETGSLVFGGEMEMTTDPKVYLSPEYTVDYPVVNRSSYTGGPKITVNAATSSVQLPSKKACFDVFVNNQGSGTASNTFIYIENPSGALIFQSLTDKTNNTDIPADFGIIPLGDFSQNESRTYEVCIINNNCSIDSLLIDGSWDCNGYPNTIEEATCRNSSTVNVEPINGEVGQTIRSPEVTSEGGLCTVVEYEILINNAQAGHLFDINSAFVLPPDLEYLPGSMQLAYPVNPSNPDWQTISDPYTWNQYGLAYRINLSQEHPTLADPEEGLVGITDLSNNYMLIKFSASADCGFATPSRLKIVTWGYNACGEFTNYVFSPSPPLEVEGAEQPFEAEVEMDNAILQSCSETAQTINLKITHKGGDAVGSNDSVRVILPAGVEYSSFTAGVNAVDQEPIVVDAGGQKILYWDLENGLSGGDVIEMTFDVYATDVGQNCGQDYDFIAQVFHNQEDVCEATGTTCFVRSVLGEQTAYVRFQKPNLSIIDFDGWATLNSPTDEELIVELTIYNGGEAIPAGTEMTINIYEDTDDDGRYSAGDVLLGPAIYTGGVGTDSYVVFTDTLIVPTGSTCRLIAHVGPQIECNCSESTSFRISAPLDIPTTTSFEGCSRDAITIGYDAIPSFNHVWVGIDGASTNLLSSTTTTPVDFTAANTSGADMTYRYALRSERGACYAYDTISITVYAEKNDVVTINVCSDSTFQLTAPLEGTNFVWSPDNGQIVDINDPRSEVIGLDTNAVFTLTYIDETGCAASFVQDIVMKSCALTAGIGDYVWEDWDGDGIQDPNEPPIAGAWVYLYDPTDLNNPIAVVQTDENGYYFFNPLPSGTYVVGFELPVASGDYEYVLTTQSSGSDGTQDSDPAQGDGTVFYTDPVSVAAGDSITDIDAGFVPVVNIGDRVWADSDQDGVQDEGEPGIEGVTVHLRDSATGAIIATTTTDANGNYLFEDVPPGSYYVQFDPSTHNSNSDITYQATTQNGGGNDSLDSDADPTTGNSHYINISPQDPHDTSVDAGYIPYADIGDYVWADTDGDGIQDADESGIEGVMVVLYDENGTPIDTTYTDANGAYVFEDYPAGTYSVGFDVTTNLNGYNYGNSPQNNGLSDATDSDIDPNTNMTAPFDFDPNNGNNTSIDAGFTPLVNLGNFVWDDLDGDGVQEVGEPPLEGAMVILFDANTGLPVDTAYTDANGEYLFEDVPVGDYFLEFNLGGVDNGTSYVATQEGTATDGADSDVNSNFRTDAFTLTEGNDDMTQDAGFYIPVDIGDYVWEDMNGNGQQDSSDLPMEGVQVILYDANTGQPVDTVYTDANGEYVFENIPPGEYYVNFSANPDTNGNPYYNVPPGLGTDSTDSDADFSGNTPVISAESGDQIDTIDAAFFQVGSIGDYVWLDTDGDGIQDADESGLEGIKVYLYDFNGTVIDSTVTDANGAYLFDNLPPGDYYLEFDPSTNTDGLIIAGTAQNQGTDSTGSDINPETNQTPVFTLTSGEDLTNIDAGFVEGIDIGNYVWNDYDNDGIQDPNEEGIEGVQVILYDTDTGLPVDTVYTDANGFYEFERVQNGNYTLVFNTTNNPDGFEFVPTNPNGEPTDTLDSDIGGTNNIGITDTFIVDVVNGDDYTIDAGFTPVADIGDYIWNDYNNDGIQDPTEEGIEGVMVVLYDDNTGLPVDTVYTDANGEYVFEDVIPGDYYIEFNPTTNTDGYDFMNSPTGQGTDSTDSDVQSNGDNSDDTPWSSTAPFTFDPESGDVLTIDAGFTPVADIGNYVWNDYDNDGIQDADESGIEGVMVILYDDNTGQPIDTAYTDANGEYVFENVIPGDYHIEFNPAPNSDGYDYINSPTGQGTDSTDSNVQSNGDNSNDTPWSSTPSFTFDPENGDDLTIDAGFTPSSSIGDSVWEDWDNDGIQDPDEAGIEDVMVILYLADGTPVDTVYTDANGNYEFENVIPGDYYVGFNPSNNPDGYNYINAPTGQGTDSTDSNVQSNGDNSDDTPWSYTPVFTYDPQDGDDLTVDAGFTPVANIGNYVWEDLDIDGIQDAGEPGIEGVTVYLYDSNTGLPVDTAITDANGYYEFENVIPGDYYLEFDESTNTQGLTNLEGTYQNTTDTANDSNIDPYTDISNTFTFNPHIGDDNSIDAGFFQEGLIGDYVWNDANGDGEQDAGEQPMDSIRVILYDSNTGLPMDTVYTDENGYYEFDRLHPGAYYVEFDIPDNFIASPQDNVMTPFGDSPADSDIDSTGTTPTIDITYGEQEHDIDAGFTPVHTIGNYVWSDDNGDGIQDPNEDGIEGVMVILYSSGNVPLDTVYTDANGQYEFTDIPSGNYYVHFEPDATGDEYNLSPANQTNDSLDSDVNQWYNSSVFTLNGSNPTIDIDAGFIPVEPLTISGYTWHDENKDGIQDPTEEPIDSVMVVLYDAETGLPVDTVYTDAAGLYEFEDVPPGDYYIEFDPTDDNLTNSPPNTTDDHNDSDANTGGQTGVITITDTPVENVDAGFYTPEGGTLPIELVYFGVEDAGCRNVLSWKTTSEENSKLFEIQKSIDGINFVKIGEVRAKGEQTQGANYEFVDKVPETQSYYRLKHIETTGEFTISTIVSVKSDCEQNQVLTNEISILYPNPVTTEEVNVLYHSNMVDKSAKLVVMDELGQVIRTYTYDILFGVNHLTFETKDLPVATYFVRVITDTKESSTFKFVKIVK